MGKDIGQGEMNQPLAQFSFHHNICPDGDRVQQLLAYRCESIFFIKLYGGHKFGTGNQVNPLGVECCEFIHGGRHKQIGIPFPLMFRSYSNSGDLVDRITFIEKCANTERLSLIRNQSEDIATVLDDFLRITHKSPVILLEFEIGRNTLFV